MISKALYLPQAQIDRTKWDNAIMSCDENLPYGLTWYLDATTNGQWDGLVMGDYQWVMPLCWNSKIPTIKQIYQPIMTQQLGVFGAELTLEIIDTFIESIPAKFKKIQINFHSKTPNIGMQLGWKSRTNLLVTLNKPYDQIHQGFAKSLKKRLRTTENLRISEMDNCQMIIDFFESNLAQKEGFPEVDYQIPKKLFASALAHKMLKMYVVQNVDGITIASGAFLDFKGRLINIFGSSNNEGKNLFAMHALINHIIKTHAESHVLFDFEGSDIEGIKSFFTSFGAENSPYFSYSKDKTSLLIKGIAKLAKRIKS